MNMMSGGKETGEDGVMATERERERELSDEGETFQ